MINLLRGKSSKNTRLGEYCAMPLEKNMVLMQNVCVVGAAYFTENHSNLNYSAEFKQGKR